MAFRPSEPVHDWTGDGRHAMLVCGWTSRLLVDSAASKAALASREVNSGEKFTEPRTDTHFSGNPVNQASRMFAIRYNVPCHVVYGSSIRRNFRCARRCCLYPYRVCRDKAK